MKVYLMIGLMLFVLTGCTTEQRQVITVTQPPLKYATVSISNFPQVVNYRCRTDMSFDNVTEFSRNYFSNLEMFTKEITSKNTDYTFRMPRLGILYDDPYGDLVNTKQFRDYLNKQKGTITCFLEYNTTHITINYTDNTGYKMSFPVYLGFNIPHNLYCMMQDNCASYNEIKVCLPAYLCQYQYGGQSAKSTLDLYQLSLDMQNEAISNILLVVEGQ